MRKARPEDLSHIQDIEVAAGELFRSIGMDAIADDPPPSEDELMAYQREGRAWVATDPADRPATTKRTCQKSHHARPNLPKQGDPRRPSPEFVPHPHDNPRLNSQHPRQPTSTTRTKPRKSDNTHGYGPCSCSVRPVLGATVVAAYRNSMNAGPAMSTPKAAPTTTCAGV